MAAQRRAGEVMAPAVPRQWKNPPRDARAWGRITSPHIWRCVCCAVTSLILMSFPPNIPASNPEYNFKLH